jgi:putative membrane protein
MKAKRIIALLLAAMMLLCTACSGKGVDTTTTNDGQDEYIQPSYDTAAGSVTKTETVYVNLKANGDVSKVSVSDWLHTDKNEVYVDDMSDLENITNVKSKVTPVTDGEKLRWNMPDTDLYYSGTTDRELPISVQLKYYLDGKEIKPEDLAGKSGEVKIDIKMINNASKDGFVNGKKHKVYLPMLVVGGMVLPEGTFSGVTVKNGQSIGDGSKEIVVFTGMPGFSESLGFSEKDLGDLGGLVIGSEASVTATVENFSLGNLYFAALPIASLNLDIAAPETVDDLKSTLAALKTFQNALNKIDPDKLLYSMITDKDKVTTLMNTLTKTIEVYKKNQNLVKMLGKYATPENAEAIKTLLESLNDPDVQNALKILADPTVQKLFNKLPGIMEGFEAVSPLLNEMQADLAKPEVKAELDNLPETMKTLSEISDTLNANSKEINAIVALLSGDGTDMVNTLLESIDLDDFKGLGDKYGDLVSDGDVLVALAQEWLNYGKDYGLFTKSAEGMKTSLAFILTTESISAPVETNTDTETTEARPWYKKIFSK